MYDIIFYLIWTPYHYTTRFGVLAELFKLLLW